MAILARLLICLLAVSVPAQTWAVPMLCNPDAAVESAEIEQQHGGHAHHAETNEGSSAPEESKAECATDCECTECVTTVARSGDEFTTSISYRIERSVQRYHHPGPIPDKLLRPPIDR